MSRNVEEEKPPPVIPCCIGLPLLLLGAILSVPYVGIAMVVQFLLERRFQRRMQKQGKFINWRDLVVNLDEGQGTIIMERRHKMATRIWWTIDNIPALYHEVMPTEEEMDEVHLLYQFKADASHPFVEWGFSRYLNSTTGLAYLTNAPRVIMEAAWDFNSRQSFKSQFPKIQAIDTVRKV